MAINKVICENAIEEGDMIYFPLFYGNGLYSFNKKTNQANRLGSFPGQPFNVHRLYEGLIKVGSKIIAIPSYGEAVISIYDLDSKKFETIDLQPYCGENVDSWRKDFKFFNCIPHKNFIFIIGRHYPVILKMDIDTYRIECITQWATEIEQPYLWDGFIQDGCGYFVFSQTSAFLKLDLESGKTEIIRFDASVQQFAGIIPGKANDFWMIGAFKAVAVNVSASGEVLGEVKLYTPPTWADGMATLENPIPEGNGVYLFPVCAEHVYYFDFLTKTCVVCQEFEEIMNRSQRKGRSFFSFQTRPHFAYIVETETQLWHELDLSTREIRTFYVLQDVSVFQKGAKEGQNFTLQDLIDLLDVNNIDLSKKTEEG